MALPLWANQVWARQPDVQQMIATQQAQQARQAQTMLAGVQLQVEQQKIAAEQRQFQESMALKMDQEKSRQAAQAWEMQLAEKKLQQDALVAQANIAKLNAQAKSYGGGVGFPVPATTPYPTMTGTGAPDQVTSEEFVIPLPAEAQPESVQPSTDPTQLPAGTIQGLGGTTPTSDVLTGQPSVTLPSPTINPLAPTPKAVTNEATAGFNALTGTTTKPQEQPTQSPPPNVELGRTYKIGDTALYRQLPGSMEQYGTLTTDTKGRVKESWNAPIAIESASERSAKAKETRYASDIEAKKATLRAVLSMQPPNIQSAAAKVVQPLLTGSSDFNDTQVIAAINNMGKNAQYAAKLLEDSKRYGTEQEWKMATATARTMSDLSEAYQGRFLGNTDQQKTYDEKIAPLQEKLDGIRASLDEKIAKLTGQTTTTATTTPPPAAAPAAPTAQTSYLQSLFKTAK